jgi:hypothetical protein
MTPTTDEERAMQYLLLIYANEERENAKPAEAVQARMANYGLFTKGIVESGAYVGGNRLRDTSDATTVRVRGGKTVTTDGPFAETREALGGYYLVEAATIDEAMAMAAKIPSALDGCVEVRPVWSM